MTLQSSLAAHEKWALCPDRTAATAPARAAFEKRFETLVDPDGALTPKERAKRAANARQAHFQRMALKSAKSRRAKAGVR